MISNQNHHSNSFNDVLSPTTNPSGILERAMPVEEEAMGAELGAKFILDHADTFCGIDVAGDERFSCSKFKRYFEMAKEKGLGLTVHAGEATGPESVWEALQLGASRIGHGFKSIQDSLLVHQLVENEITLEICPWSNVLTGSVDSAESHPVRALINKGVHVCISSDDPGVFHHNLLDDYKLLVEHHGFTEHDFKQANLLALEASFLPENIKDKVRHQYFS